MRKFMSLLFVVTRDCLVFNDQSKAGKDNPVKAGLSAVDVSKNHKKHAKTFQYIASSHQDISVMVWGKGKFLVPL